MTDAAITLAVLLQESVCRTVKIMEHVADIPCIMDVAGRETQSVALTSYSHFQGQYTCSFINIILCYVYFLFKLFIYSTVTPTTSIFPVAPHSFAFLPMTYNPIVHISHR